MFCSDSEYAATFELLKEFTSLAEDGWISLTVNGHPVLLVNGKEERYKELLTSIYQTLSLLKTKNN